MVNIEQEPWYYSKPSADGKKLLGYQYLNSITPFILSLVISLWGLD